MLPPVTKGTAVSINSSTLPMWVQASFLAAGLVPSGLQQFDGVKMTTVEGPSSSAKTMHDMLRLASPSFDVFSIPTLISQVPDSHSERVHSGYSTS